MTLSTLNWLGICGIVLVTAAVAGLPPRPRGDGPSGAPPTPSQDLRRIASLSTRADQILIRILPRHRLAAVTAASQRTDPVRFDGLAAIAEIDDLEAILSLDPDLVVVNGFFDPRRIARLREAGLTVLDLGPLDDAAGFVEDALHLGRVVGLPDVTRRWIRTFEERLVQISADIPEVSRPSALVLTAYGGQLYSAGRGTSYHDVLTFGGVRNAASDLSGWPTLDAEAVLGLEPEYVVTESGMGTTICRRPGLSSLPACQDPSRIVEIPTDLLGDPGLGIAEAAAEVRRQVHGAPPALPRD